MRKLLWGVMIGQLLIAIIGAAEPFEVYSARIGLVKKAGSGSRPA
jgi:hypothetical protein